MATIFEFKDYKRYLVSIENAKEIRSFRTKLARAAGCQNAYVSQVLNGESQFNLEQAEGIAGFLEFTHDEQEYFFLMLQHARAGTASLRKFIASQMTRRREQQLALSQRVHTGESLSEAEQLQYYREWHYSAIHVLVTIGEFQTREAISSRLGLSLRIVKRAVEFLLECGLLKEEKGRLQTGAKRLYLGSESPLINKHHSNWRIHVLQSLSQAEPTDLHYSSVVTVSEEDAEKIKEQLIQAIREAKERIKSSPEEDIFAFHLDFYRL
jgi:uncharacterized protein (TIGR02147 family)